jgi:hypothetical protein
MRLNKLTVLAAFAGLLAAPSAFATATLSFSVDGGAAVTCADGAMCDINSTAGVVTYSADLGGGFIVNVTTGITTPFYTGSSMDLNSVNVQSGSGNHTLEIMFSQTDFTSTMGGFEGGFGGTIGTGGTVVASAGYDTTNTLFGNGTNIASTGSLGPGAFSATFSGGGPGTSPYSLTQILTISTSQALTFSGDFALTQVPEPASIVLLGGALLFVAGGIRRKMRRA